MAQAREAAGIFLDKLPVKADCGLILFDHEMRPPVVAPTVNRKILLDEIRKVQPRGGTAYLDAVAKGSPCSRRRASMTSVPWSS